MTRYTPPRATRTRRALRTTATYLAAIAAIGAASASIAASSALADDVVDINCPATGSTNCTQGYYWSYYDGYAGQRCDLTAKVIGGNTPMQFGFAHLNTGWSGWLNVGGTFSTAWFGIDSHGTDYTYVDAIKMHGNRSASYRFRVTGPCTIVNN